MEFTVHMFYLVNIKTIRQIVQIIVAFSEKLNFIKAWTIFSTFLKFGRNAQFDWKFFGSFFLTM